MRTAEERRHQEDRKKKKMMHVLKDIYKWKDMACNPKTVGKWAHTPHQCSSPGCCGNPRRTKGRNLLTAQELRNS
jgi:hypothetical protein